jgi:hypothetical protein
MDESMLKTIRVVEEYVGALERAYRRRRDGHDE